MNKEKFASYLSNLRKKNGLTQAELAEKIHVTDKAVSKWERGMGLPDINNIEPLADALGVSVVDLMKSDEIQINEPKETAVEAIQNTISLVKLQNRKLKMRVISLFMIYIALKGIYGIFLDTNNHSNYNNLPMPVVYTLLTIYVILTAVLTYRSFRKSMY